MTSPFTAAEAAYLTGQPLGRLATIDQHDTPQNNAVGFWLNEELGTVDIGGRRLSQTRKFRNIGHHPRVSLVVDELVSTNPWTVRGMEIRGRAVALAGSETGDDDPRTRRGVIRIHPDRILTWGDIEPGGQPFRARSVRG